MGATALIAVNGSAKITALGYLFVIFPVLTGALIMLVVAPVFNNVTKDRKHPTDERFTKTMNRMFMRKKKIRAVSRTAEQ